MYQNVISCLYLDHSNILHVLITSAFIDKVGTVHISIGVLLLCHALGGICHNFPVVGGCWAALLPPLVEEVVGCLT
jgi:hypothetical protein